MIQALTICPIFHIFLPKILQLGDTFGCHHLAPFLCWQRVQVRCLEWAWITQTENKQGIMLMTSTYKHINMSIFGSRGQWRDPDFQIRGGHLDPGNRGGGLKKFFSALWASLWSKNKGCQPPPPPRPSSSPGSTNGVRSVTFSSKCWIKCANN